MAVTVTYTTKFMFTEAGVLLDAQRWCENCGLPLPGEDGPVMHHAMSHVLQKEVK